MRGASAESNAGPSTSLQPFPLPLPTAQEATSGSAAPAVVKRAPRAKRVVDPSDRVLRTNPKQAVKVTEMAPAIEAPAPKRRAAGEATGGPATKKARTNTEATSAGRPASGARAKTAAPSSEATKARKPSSRHTTTTSARSSKAAVAPPAEASLSTAATTTTSEASSPTITTAAIASAPEPSRRASKRKAATMTGPATKKARITSEASSTVTRGATKAKASAKGKVTQAPIGKGKKRAIEDDDDDDTAPPPPPQPKKAREIKPAKAPPPKVVINNVPKQRLDVFVCGEGSSGELGLGVAKKAIDVKRPRLNPFLSASEVGVVHVATGGMHAAAITHDNLILTWGVNDQGALGRDTTWDGGMRDVDDDSDDESQDTNGLNPRECTPTAIPRENFPPGVVFVQLACGDSSTFALTDDGDVYGWGTFRSNDGILGFSKEVKIQAIPVKLPSLKKITQIACGANHALALRENGDVYIWGSGEQNQLGHRIVERKRYDSLKPTLLRLNKKCRLVGCGLDHSFAVERNETVWTWGLNSFGETGIAEGAGGDSAVVFFPVPVSSLALQNDTITSITGGAHHSVATTANGELLIWGRLDGHQMGLDIASLPDTALIKDVSNQARILIRPTPVPAGTIGTARMAAAGTDHTISINADGEAFSWGFNVNYQCGQGTTDDVELPTQIDNTAVRDRDLNWAGAGGQFSVLTSVAEFQGEEEL